MKKSACRILPVALLATLLLAGSLASCSKEKSPAPGTTAEQTDVQAPATEPEETAPEETEAVTDEVTTPVTEEETEPETEPLPPLPDADPIDPATFGAPDLTYVCDDGSVLSAYNQKTAADFEGVVSYYAHAGYLPYSATDMGGNLAATYVKGDAMAHIYWHPRGSELNIVLSDTAGATLPPKTPAVTTGDYECSITQIKDTQNFIGMGYVIQLTDGSFIVYDGSYANQAPYVLRQITQSYQGEGKPVIRAWVLTHSHNDHYPAFETIANKKSYRDKIVVENVIVAPLNDANYTLNDSEEFYLSTKFYEDAALLGANVVFAHTGMEFKFCNLNMEILYSPESVYKYTADKGNFNSTSPVTRLYDESYSALFTGDVSNTGVDFMMNAYDESDYLKSDVCQMSHHGVEAAYILPFYDEVAPQIMFYPASVSLFTSNDDAYNPEVHNTLFTRDYIKEILVHGYDKFTRAWGTTFDADTPLTVPGFKIPDPVIGEEISVQNGTGTRTAMRITDWMGYRIAVNGEITGFAYDIPTWASTTSDCTLALYRWNTDVTATLAAEPVASRRMEDVMDNGTCRFNFDQPQPAGEYLFVICDVNGAIGVYYNKDSVGGAGVMYTPDGESLEQPTLRIAFSEMPAIPFKGGENSLTLDKTTYTEGEAIQITAYGFNKDWVGIVKKGETTPLRWWYLLPTSDGAHAPMGEAFDAVRLPANINGDGKLPAGEYTVYVLSAGDTVTDENIIASTDITITPAVGQTPTPDGLTPQIHLTFDGNADEANGGVTVNTSGSVTYEEGKNGQAAVLGFAYVSIPDFAPVGSFTVSVWAKITNLTGDPALFATKDWQGGSNVGFALGVTDGGLHANIGDGENRADHKPSLAGVALNEWNHYTLVFDRDAREIRVSVNFGTFTTATLPNKLVNAPYEGDGQLVIGQDISGCYSGGSMTCVMDDFMVFDRALTQADLTALAQDFGD